MKNLEQLVDEIHAEHVARISPRRRGERQIIRSHIQILKCKKCEVLFSAPRWRKREYCSQSCANSHAPKYRIEDLQRLAAAGEQNIEMARILGMEPNSVRKALIREGLHRQWSLARYKKCRNVA